VDVLAESKGSAMTVTLSAMGLAEYNIQRGMAK